MLHEYHPQLPPPAQMHMQSVHKQGRGAGNNYWYRRTGVQHRGLTFESKLFVSLLFLYCIHSNIYMFCTCASAPVGICVPSIVRACMCSRA